MKQAWSSGLVCLHPTDTLPGLSFDPRSEEAWKRFLKIKERAPEKSPIALIADMKMADQVWEPLPKGWKKALQALWPASLSVVWKASGKCPSHLLATDGTCSLRMPAWSAESAWMQDFLRELDAPFPSSSVNRSGDPAIADWDEAKRFLAPFVADGLAFVAETKAAAMVGTSSTLIKILDDGKYAMIRAGAVSKEQIDREVRLHVGHL